ncbi:hypothetical protein SAMN05216249_10113 [Acetitomaculum ruminis DSM 5522]|uniref:Uncharacterized protein n=1 Tax=Acetitomaculum ruminis DSM 5522 TaxID=1120918 RepID=A0A1I0UXF2_9FIRM|nr:NAD(P)H-binding protein [Acetitomaculum ruminis]SFA68711.1 hypothetical protein SAMN05216249_10113 [Acetitomaculum ruminis DSM 5522]
MKAIAVLAANGKVAKRIITEAVNRGHFVIGYGIQKKNYTDARIYIQKTILEMTPKDMEGFAVVVDCYGPQNPRSITRHREIINHLCDILAGTDTRLIIMGGAGLLYYNKATGKMLADVPNYPEHKKYITKQMAAALEDLKQRTDVNWLFINPAIKFMVEGERTGKYILAGDEIRLNSKRESIISYKDYAVAMVDEIERCRFNRVMISVLRE